MTEQTLITQIEQRSLPTAMRGYDRAATDKLLDELKASLQTLITERNAAQARVQEFESRVTSLEEREKEITEALVVATRVLVQSEQESKAKAEERIHEAHAEAERIMSEARSSAGRFEQETREVEQLAVRARQQLTSFLESLLAEIELRGSDLGSVVHDLVGRIGETSRSSADEVDDVTSGAPSQGMHER
jgi:cell division septum initiation protein DivIVA